MNDLSKLFVPFSAISRKTVLTLIVAETIVALLIWQLSGNGLIPSPTKVLDALGRVASDPNFSFADNFMSSLFLTLKGMGISILIALAVSYLALIPVFNPVAHFIIKCRYLTLTGLIFVFTLMTDNGSQLKMSLLIFGIVPFFVTSLLSIIEGINKQEYELCRTLRMNNWQILWEVVIVGRFDQVFEVMRQNFAIAWMMITMVEGLSMSEGGLGTLLIKANKFVDMAQVFAILLVIFVLGILFDILLGQLRRWLFPYTKIETAK
ncbi:MAG: ABC transporter permease subunit [Bacteroidia bacterium]|jgi:NitT/TauT family transport system permease protein|nr:ABC transporter permease subunit [Bacteroidia bacterium]